MCKNCCVVHSHPNLFNHHTIVSNDELYRSLPCEIRTVAAFLLLAQVPFLCSHSCQLHQMFTSTREQGRDVNNRLNPIHGGLLTGGKGYWKFCRFHCYGHSGIRKTWKFEYNSVTAVLILSAVICKRITSFNAKNISLCQQNAYFAVCNS